MSSDPSPLDAPETGRAEQPEWLGAEAGSGPGTGVFSLQGRPAAGLYLAAWLLSGIGAFALVLALVLPAGAAALLAVVALGLLLLGLGAAGGYQIVARRNRADGAYRGPSPVIIFFVALAGVVAVESVVIITTGLDPLTPWGAFVSLVIQVGGYFIAGWLAVVRSGALSWREMLRPPTASGGPIAAVAAGVLLIIPVALLALVIGSLLAQLLNVEAPQQLPPPTTSMDWLLTFATAVVVAPIGEEFFFRGLSLSAWLRDLGPRSALIRSTLFFALIHLLVITSFNFSTGLRQVILVVAVILPIGLALGWLYLRRGLVASIAAHATYNGLLLALTMLRPDLTSTLGLK